MSLRLPRTSEPGEFTRAQVNTTSSAPNASPLWNFTPRRRLKRQTMGVVIFQDSASAGSIFSLSSKRTRDSYTLVTKALVNVLLDECGSIDTASIPAVHAKVLALAGSAARLMTSIAMMRRFEILIGQTPFSLEKPGLEYLATESPNCSGQRHPPVARTPAQTRSLSAGNELITWCRSVSVLVPITHVESIQAAEVIFFQCSLRPGVASQ